MKRVTASEARKNWFRLLDEVARGEKVVIERQGRRILVVREEPKEAKAREAVPDYRKLIEAPQVDEADHWSWNWSGDGLELQDRKPR